MAEALKAKCRGEACLARPRSGIRTAHSVQGTIVSAALPDLSLRGPKGAVAISCDRSRFRRKFPVIRHCTVRLPRRFAPRNDTSGGVPWCTSALLPLNCLCTRRSVSAATDAIGAYRFIDGRYESEVPPRDCHVGRWPPRNDKSEAGFILTKACTGRRRCAGRGMPLPCNTQKYPGNITQNHSKFDHSGGDCAMQDYFHPQMTQQELLAMSVSGAGAHRRRRV